MKQEDLSISHQENSVHSVKSDKEQLLSRLKSKCKKVLNAITSNQIISECDVSSIELTGTYFERYLNKMLDQEFTLDREDSERVISIVKQIKENQGNRGNEWIMRYISLLLEQQNQSERPIKQLNRPSKSLFSQNLFFSPKKTHEQAADEQIGQKIIQGHSLKIRNDQFSVVFTLLTSNTMAAIVKHFNYDFETMVTIDVRDLSSQASSFFKDTLTLFKYLQSLRKIEARLTDEGALEILIEHRAFDILQKVDKVYKELAEIADGALQFNQSDTFERIVKHRYHPEKPLPSHLQQLILFQPSKKALEIVVLELFGKCEFQSAARIYRFMIDEILRVNSLWQNFQGRGNQKDLLEMLNQINQGNMQQILKDLSYFDCLFICEYLSIDLERSKAWYKKHWQQLMKNNQKKNRAVIYGILNFLHQHYCYFLSNDDVIRLCRELEDLCKDQHKIAASQLLIGIYYDLSKRQPNRRQQYYTKAVILARTVIGVDPTNEAAWLVLCASIMSNTLYIVQNQLFKGIRFGVIQAEAWMKQPNNIKHADDILSQIVKQNPYYRAAYHASLKLERSKLTQILKLENPTMPLKQCIIRASGIYGQCSKYFPNDLRSKYLLARVLEDSNESGQRDNAIKLYRECEKENPFMEKLKFRLDNVKKLPKQCQ